MEQTLVLIKPDGVQRGLIGEVLGRFERVGLKIVALKMVQPERDQVDKHYALTEEWMLGVYTKAKAKFDAEGKTFPYPNHIAYGTEIKNGLMEFLVSAPVVAMVLEGEGAVAIVRKLTGATEPAGSPPGTIRGDFAQDSYPFANSQKRPIRNIIHASGTVEEAKNELAVWFKPEELMKYEHVNDHVLYDATWFLPKV